MIPTDMTPNQTAPPTNSEDYFFGCQVNKQNITQTNPNITIKIRLAHMNDNPSILLFFFSSLCLAKRWARILLPNSGFNTAGRSLQSVVTTCWPVVLGANVCKQNAAADKYLWVKNATQSTMSWDGSIILSGCYLQLQNVLPGIEGYIVSATL